MMDKAPFNQEVAEGPNNGEAFWIRTDDNIRLRVAKWDTTSDCKGTVFLLPGRTGYVERWGRIARELDSFGFSSFVIDWRGHGLSDRITEDPRICHIKRFSDYQLDINAMLKAAQEHNLPKPWFMLGNSMGACIGLRALMSGFPVSACAFIAPMWGIKFSPVMRTIAWLLSWAAQGIGKDSKYAPGQNENAYVLCHTFEENSMTHDADMYQYWVNQAQAHPELLLGGVSFGWLYQSLREGRMLSKLDSPNIPCLAYCGDQDQDVDLTSIQNRMSSWENGRFEVIQDSKHDILSEVPEIRSKVMGEVCNLFASNNQ